MTTKGSAEAVTAWTTREKKPKRSNDKKKNKKKKRSVDSDTNDKKYDRLMKKREKKKKEKEKKLRLKNEFGLLEREMMKGKELANTELINFEVKVGRMLAEGASDDDDSEEFEVPVTKGKKEKKKKDSEPEDEPITDKKLLQKYQVDREDYLLQYANADEKPIYLDEYSPENYACFQGVDMVEWSGNVATVFKQLFKYTDEVWKFHTAPSLDHLPQIFFHTQSLRPTSEYTNFCFNPLQAMRAWGLLLTIAQSKTAVELRAFIDTYTHGAPLKKKKKDDELPDVHEELLSLHHDAEAMFDGCVRLFTELPHHLKPVTAGWRRYINQLYGGKSRRAGIQHHCFATDSDGLYSCYRINEEVSLSTHGAVRYVVPENCAPNWRASIALVSATDCRFYWKTTDTAPKEVTNYVFDGGPKKKSRCTMISATANVHVKKGPSGEPVYRLESHVPDVSLYIFLENSDDYNRPKCFPPEFDTIINSPDGWVLSLNQMVHIPKCTTAQPISLFDHAKHNGLSRLFCSEKSELKQMKMCKEQFSGSPQYTTLFDHYHKTVFEISPRPPESLKVGGEFDQLAPQRAHQCIEESSAKVFGKFQRKKKNKTEFLTYFEDHLYLPFNSIEHVEDSFDFVTPPATDINLGKPFYYVMTRTFEERQMIVCAGYYNNTVWAVQKKNEVKKGEV